MFCLNFKDPISELRNPSSNRDLKIYKKQHFLHEEKTSYELARWEENYSW